MKYLTRRSLNAALMATTIISTGTLLMPLAAHAQAEAYPSKPITLVVPNPPGGLVDTSARLVSEPLSRVTGQSVVVDNKPGGSGNLAYANVARSAKDGYTVLVSYSGYHIANPILMDKLPWELKDLTPVGLITVATNVIAVHPSVPANNLKEFIAWAKQNPGKINYASQGNGSVSHIGTEIFKQQTGIEMTHVPYKGSGQAIQDVLAGQVQVFITTPPSVMGHVLNGKLKALAVTGKTRHPQLPQVPTAAEAGLSGFELESWVALYVPNGTPKDVVQKLSAEVKADRDLASVVSQDFIGRYRTGLGNRLFQRDCSLITDISRQDFGKCTESSRVGGNARPAGRSNIGTERNELLFHRANQIRLGHAFGQQHEPRPVRFREVLLGRRRQLLGGQAGDHRVFVADGAEVVAVLETAADRAQPVAVLLARHFELTTLLLAHPFHFRRAGRHATQGIELLLHGGEHRLCLLRRRAVADHHLPLLSRRARVLRAHRHRVRAAQRFA